MAAKFTEKITHYLGYVIRQRDNSIVGTWLWKGGNMSISTSDRELDSYTRSLKWFSNQDLIQGVITLQYAIKDSVGLSPIELSVLLYPEYLCITADQLKDKKIKLMANDGKSVSPIPKVLRGYVLESIRGREITIGVWTMSSEGIVAISSSNTFLRAFNNIKDKLETIRLTPDGVESIPLKFKDATYFDVNLKLSSNFFLVPSWGIEGEIKKEYR